MIIYKQIKKTTKGFTLIELILTVIAIGIFGNITANILGNASKIYKETLNKQKFVSEARHSFFRINRDLNLQTCLVKTGKYGKQLYPKSLKPHYLLPKLSAVKSILS